MTQNNLLDFSNLISRCEKFSFWVIWILLPIALYYALYASPIDEKQKDAVRILYIHVPSAWISIGFFSIAGILSGINLFQKHYNLYLFIHALAFVGTFFSITTLITGSIWGKPIWGTWWVGDPRLISSLILTIFYVSYLIILGSFSNREYGYKISSIILIIGLVNIPIIKLSVYIWNSIHQQSTFIRSEGVAMEYSMIIPLVLVTIWSIFYSLYAICKFIKLNM